MVLMKPMPLTSCLGLVGVATLAAGCTAERIGSQLEFEAVGACASAIEERLGRELPSGWQYLKEERKDVAVMKAWTPGRDEPMPPDYTCVLVKDEDARGGVRVVDVVEGAGEG